MHLLREITFGKTGNSRPYILEGMAEPEDSFTWTIGTRTRLGWRVPQNFDPNHILLLEFDLSPFVVDGALFTQYLKVFVDGNLVGDQIIEMAIIVAYEAAVNIKPGAILTIELQHDGAQRPCDFGISDDQRQLGFLLRKLSLYSAIDLPRPSCVPCSPLVFEPSQDARRAAVQAYCGIALDDLAMRFETLGQNCELSFVQRSAGVEPLHFLRFTGISLPHLIDALLHEFEGIEQFEVIPPSENIGEFMLRSERYKISVHSFVSGHESTIENVKTNFRRRMSFLRTHFLQHLYEGDHIFVFQQKGRISLHAILPLLHALRRFGPNALLFVDQDRALPGGSVVQLAPGFFHGALDRAERGFNISNPDLDGWYSIMANTYRLWQQGRAPSL